MSEIRLELPRKFNFRQSGVYDFTNVLRLFDWNNSNENTIINLGECYEPNYQALSLIVLYTWYSRARGSWVNFEFNETGEGATSMWKKMGAVGWSQVLYSESQNFNSDIYKPLIAIRNQADLAQATRSIEIYTKGFNIQYEKTLRYVISELLYNTLEHGKNALIPSLIQYSWYREKEELSFIVADLGIGIKAHLEQTYPVFDNHIDAIRYAIKPQVSGTFGQVSSIYQTKDNAGVGLYLSTNIIKKLNADMHIVSGNGVLHISPVDVTGATISANWPGTLVLVTIKLHNHNTFDYEDMMSELRQAARTEIDERERIEQGEQLYVNVLNYFGKFAELKDEAKVFRDRYILPAVSENKVIILDFKGVFSAPHSFLSALLATPIERYGMMAYKKIKVVNAEPDIRETIDYILNDNT